MQPQTHTASQTTFGPQTAISLTASRRWLTMLFERSAPTAEKIVESHKDMDWRPFEGLL
jgi:hypothetical protein